MKILLPGARSRFMAPAGDAPPVVAGSRPGVVDETVVRAASATLFLPDGESQARLPRGCAQLTLHMDLVPHTPISVSGQMSFRRPPYWRARFAQALALPGELADWLEHQLGLTTSSHPAA